jgi:hypothetical protein
MPNGQIDPRTTVAAQPAAKREQGHIVLRSAPWTFDSHVQPYCTYLPGIDVYFAPPAIQILPNRIRFLQGLHGLAQLVIG